MFEVPLILHVKTVLLINKLGNQQTIKQKLINFAESLILISIRPSKAIFFSSIIRFCFYTICASGRLREEGFERINSFAWDLIGF